MSWFVVLAKVLGSFSVTTNTVRPPAVGGGGKINVIFAFFYFVFGVSISADLEHT